MKKLLVNILHIILDKIDPSVPEKLPEEKTIEELINESNFDFDQINAIDNYWNILDEFSSFKVDLIKSGFYERDYTTLYKDQREIFYES